MIKHERNGHVTGESLQVSLLTRIALAAEASLRLQIAPVLERELEDPKIRQLYDETGTVAAEQLAKKLRISTATLCAKWKRWEQLGLMVKDGKSYRKVV